MIRLQRGFKSQARRLACLLSALLLWSLPALVHGQSEVVEYYHLDAAGNVRAVTNQAGQVIERHDYLPFGEECTTGPCAANLALGAGQPRKFTGKERDPETGLDYFGARYYGSRIGRFTTTDPVTDLRASIVNPQKWNRYAYGLNNPLRYVDPDGRQEAHAGIWAGRETIRRELGEDALKQYDAATQSGLKQGFVVGGLVAASFGAAYAVPASWLGGAAGGSVVLGETMPRVAPVAKELGAKTFQTPWTNFTDVMAKNMAWLKDQMASGNRILDVGLDPGRAARSDFYAAETKALQAAGYVRQYVSDVKVGEVVQKVYEWVRPAAEATK